VCNHISPLFPDQQSRYGSLDRGYETMAAHAHRTASMEPEVVTRVIIEALDSERPDARYVVGDDATRLSAALRQLSVVEMDALLAELFREPV
jgi:hypothetical protein